MKTTAAELAATLSRARYAALSAWLQGVPPDQVVMRWLMPDDTDRVPTTRAAIAMLTALLAGARLRARQHGQSELEQRLAAARWTGMARRRAVEALRRLEAIGTPVPHPCHGVDLWLSRRTVARLKAVGVHTVDELIALCNRYGRTWFRRVPGLGITGAERVCAFLNQHATHFPGWDMRAMQASYVSPRVESRPPLDAAAAHGAYPSAKMWYGVTHTATGYSESIDAIARPSGPVEPTLWDARDDEAVQRWLAQWPSESRTRAAYSREVGRFMAWLRIERGKVLSAVLPSDCVAYAAFLSRLSLESKWCGPRLPRAVWIGDAVAVNPAWRPFTGSLSPRSQAYSRLVLRLLFAWLVRKRYLVTNPWVDICHVTPERRLDQPPLQIPDRFWEALLRWLDYVACDSPRGRLWRAALLLLADTGLSCEDAAVARPEVIPGADGATGAAPVRGELVVQRKDSQLHAVPVSPRLSAALRSHWRDRDDPLCYALGYPRGVRAPRTNMVATPTQPSHYSARGLRQLVWQAMSAFNASLTLNERDLGQWSAHIRPGDLSHGVVARALPERLRGKDGPLQITVRQRLRR